jgi:hypothetical protein
MSNVFKSWYQEYFYLDMTIGMYSREVRKPGSWFEFGFWKPELNQGQIVKPEVRVSMVFWETLIKQPPFSYGPAWANFVYGTEPISLLLSNWSHASMIAQDNNVRAMAASMWESLKIALQKPKPKPFILTTKLVLSITLVT